MKRTTYILIGLFVAGLCVLVGGMFMIFCLGRPYISNQLNLQGEQITKEVPACRVVWLTQTRLYTPERNVWLANSLLEVQPSKEGKNLFSCSKKVNDYLKMTVMGDTLKILLDYSLDQLPQEFKKSKFMAGVLLAYNDGTLLGVYGGSSEQLQKLQPAITALMQQPADKSIHANKHFTSMLQQKGDIRLLATPDALPMDVRGVLNWPHGTQLLGYVLFENGRIYATLQSADFKGDTKEDNQPFHPKNSRELQQAMLSMMHGRPFNISLTSDELLTLSNLRVLMEYASDEPEIKNLYQMIMKIEELNLRGDKNRTNFTIVLNEKKENALKQLVDFAKLFAGSNP